MEKPPQHQTKPMNQMMKGEDDQIGELPDDEDDRVSKLPDDILVRVLSLLRYRDAVRTASVSRRWEHVVCTQLPDLNFSMSLLGYRTSKGTPSEQRVQSMERTLRRRCCHHSVRTLGLVYRKDEPMECRYADEFIALANARRLTLDIQCARGLPDEDAGAWCVGLPLATAELHVLPYWYAVRPPHIRGPGAGALRSLTLKGLTVLRQEFLDTDLPSLEDLRIGECTIAASISIASDAMPRLKHLDIADVAVMTNDTKAGIDVLADELRTLRVSCFWGSKTEPASDEVEMFRLPARFRASFTAYSSFRLRAPKLRVFDWRCCHPDEVRVESVGRLSEVVVELAAGRKPRTNDEELSYVTVDQRDKLMTDILQGLMPGLQPLTWRKVKRKCVQRDDRWVCFEITNAMRLHS